MPKLSHYLRIERRRQGLTQQDVAVLLGVRTASKVSRYEHGHRLPPLKTALAYGVILGRPLEELFAGTYRSARNDVRRRAASLPRERNLRGARFAKRQRSIELIVN